MTFYDDPEHLDRVLVEIMDPVDVYYAGNGPEGPWPWKSLEVTRVMNDIHVYDVDGELWRTIRVPDCSDIEDPHADLRSMLDTANERSLAEL